MLVDLLNMSKQTKVKTSTFSPPYEGRMGSGFPKHPASAGSQQALCSLAMPAGPHLQPEPAGQRVPGRYSTSGCVASTVPHCTSLEGKHPCLQNYTYG